jgi:cytochrome P450
VAKPIAPVGPTSATLAPMGITDGAPRLREWMPPSERRSREAILRAGMPPPWPEPPLRQVHRWASDMDGLLAEAAATGSAWTFDFWRQGRMTVFTSESARKQILAASADELGHANDLAGLFVGPRSLLLRDGRDHRRARRRTLSLIGAERLPVYGETMRTVAREWLETVGPGDEIEALDACQRMTLDIILRTVMGVPRGPGYDALHRSARQFMMAGRSVAGNLAALLLPTDALRRAMLGPQDPTGGSPTLGFLGRSLPGAAEGRALVAHIRALIAERRSDPSGEDVLARLVQEGELDDAAILDEVATLLLAGHDTTAVTLGWMLYRIGRRPTLWADLRAELSEHFGDGEPLDPERLPRRGLLGACVMESLRLDGLTLGVLRRARREVTVDGYRIPAGTLVNALVRPRHLDPEQWEDPERFDPERMLGDRPPAHEYAPFGGGYRRCVGASFATYEMQIVLATIARRLELHTPPAVLVDRVQYGPFPGPSNRIPMRAVAIA